MTPAEHLDASVERVMQACESRVGQVTPCTARVPCVAVQTQVGRRRARVAFCGVCTDESGAQLRYTCASCGWSVPWCFGADDASPDLCDGCAPTSLGWRGAK